MKKNYFGSLDTKDEKVIREMEEALKKKNEYGAAYVKEGTNEISTAFKATEYDDNTNKMIDIFRKGGTNNDK